jgi:hypothetical protein
MNCERCREYLTELIEQGSGIDSRPEIRSHIEECPDCKRDYREMMALFNFLEPDRRRNIDDPRLDNIVIDINERLDSSRKVSRFDFSFVYSAAVAAVAAVLIIIIGSGGIINMESNDNRYMTGYYDDSTLVEMVAGGYSGTEIMGMLYSSMNEKLLDELEDYWIENADYSKIIDLMSDSELKYMKSRIDEQMNDIS